MFVNNFYMGIFILVLYPNQQWQIDLLKQIDDPEYKMLAERTISIGKASMFILKRKNTRPNTYQTPVILDPFC